MLDRTDVASPVERDQALAEVAPILAAMGEGASQSELVRKVADRLDLEPAMVMGRVVASTPATGGPGASARIRAARVARAGRGLQPDPGPAAPRPSSSPRANAGSGRCWRCASPSPSRAPSFLEQLGESTSRAAARPPPTSSAPIPETPAEHLPRENGALAALITELVMMAREEPASEESMELNFLLLDQRRLEDEIAAAGERGRLRAARQPQPRAGRAGGADRPRATGRGADPVNCAVRPSGPTPFRGSSIGRAFDC